MSFIACRRQSFTANTNQYVSNDSQHQMTLQMTQLKQELEMKEDLIQNLKLCLARNEKEMEKMRKERNVRASTSNVYVKAQINLNE